MRTIAPPSLDDGPSILALAERVSVFSRPELSCVEELWKAYRLGGEASGYVFLVSRDDNGAPVGYACFGAHPLTQGAWDLYWIAVAPDHQGHGVGRALLARVEAEVQARSGRMLLIETSDTPPYTKAHRLYEACGYRCEAVIEGFYALGDGLRIYVKRLQQAQARQEAPAEC